jgi:CelD/BcsL family acetyltransferase involved in cellulose biosynthesis
MLKAFDKFRKLIAHLQPAVGLSRSGTTPFTPLDLNGLTVRCDTTFPADIQPWLTLCDRVPASTLFQTPTWQIAAWTAGNTKGRLRLISVWQADRLIAVLPLALTDAGSLHTPTVPLSDYLDPLVEPSLEAECWRTILTYVESLWDPALKEFTLYNLRESATIHRVLPLIAQSLGWRVDETVCDSAPMIDLPNTWDGFLDLLDAHERKEIRRKVTKAESQGEARLIRCSESEFPSMLDLALSLMASRPDEKGHSITLYIRPLFEKVGVALFQQHRLELFTLLIHGHPACCLLQSPTPRGPMLYNLGYDAKFKEWSPGVVAIAMSIRDAISKSQSTFDLLRGQEPYKHKLGAKDRPLRRISLSCLT